MKTTVNSGGGAFIGAGNPAVFASTVKGTCFSNDNNAPIGARGCSAGVELTNLAALGLTNGVWEIIIELEGDSHTRRIKYHPQDWPPVASALVVVDCSSK